MAHEDAARNQQAHVLLDQTVPAHLSQHCAMEHAAQIGRPNAGEAARHGENGPLPKVPWHAIPPAHTTDVPAHVVSQT